MIALLDSSDGDMRSAAPGLLAQFTDRRVVEALIRTIGITDANTAANCVYSLATIAGRVRLASHGRAGDDPVGGALVRVVRDQGWVRRAGARERFAQALGFRNPESRVGAAWILGEIGDEAAVEPLRKLLRSEPDPSVQAAAREALERLVIA